MEKIQKLFMAEIKMLRSIGLVTYTKLLVLHIKEKIGLLNWLDYVKQCHPIIEEYLVKKGYKETLLRKYQEIPPPQENNTDIIWCCWLQGERHMPPLVRSCFKNLICNSSGHKVVLITLENYSGYVEIPVLAEEKLAKGKLLPAHFADLLRLKLLQKYGGLWIDATIYTTSPLPSYMFMPDFFSIKNRKPEDDNHISYHRWCSFVLGGNRRIINALCATFESYILQEKYFIHYLLIDYLIDILYNSSIEVKSFIDNTPYTEPQMHKLRQLMNEIYKESVFQKLTQETSIFKLTYKGHFNVKTSKNEQTFYGHILAK